MLDEKRAPAIYKRIDDAGRIDGPHGWIQWTGTDVCMDVRCECGQISHIDSDFVYTLRCPHCGRVYAVSAYVKLVELTSDEANAWHEPKDADP